MKAKEALKQSKELPPQTEVPIVEGLTVRRTETGIPIVKIHYTAIPERRTREWKATERKKYTSQASWDREQEIIDNAGGGELVFADVLVSHWDKIVISDPKWRPDPRWRCEGGFDHGKTNPTALLRSYHDYAGTIYLCGEYYMPGREVWENAPELKRMDDIRRLEVVFADPTIFDMTMQQSQGPGKAAERAKSINDLYVEQGIELFSPFQGDRSDVSFAARIMLHWQDLEHREPTLKIVCPNYVEKPQPGLHNWSCPNLLWELMRARRVKLTSQQLLTRNVSEAIVDKDNHARDACLVAGTLVTTLRGEVPIEDVTDDDQVLTSEGWHQVDKAWMSSPSEEIWRVAFSDGRVLLGTANHPVSVRERGFLRIDALKYGMMCLCRESTDSQRLLTGWESISTAIQTAKSAICGAITAMAASISTHSSGYLITASRFLRSTTSITRTVTVSITNLPTLRPCPVSPTYNFQRDEETSRIGATWRASGKKQASGIQVQRDGHGTLNTAGECCILSAIRSALSVARSSRTRIVGKATPFARQIAGPNGEGRIISTTKHGNANTVERDSSAASSAAPGSVHASVQVVSVEKTPLRLPVYNVSVRDQPEYFANGILVHNCKYIVMSHPEPSVKTAQQKAHEEVKPLLEHGDMTSALIRYQQQLDKEEYEQSAPAKPIPLGRRRR